MANYEGISQKKKIIGRTSLKIAEISYEKRRRRAKKKRRRAKKKTSLIISKIKKTPLITKVDWTVKDKKRAIEA